MMSKHNRSPLKLGSVLMITKTYRPQQFTCDDLFKSKNLN